MMESYDSIALFLCVHLVSRFKELCHQQKDVNALDRYWDTLHGLFWPRLQIVIKSNVQSVKDCDPQKMKITDLRPHYVTRRYAEFSTAFISINEKFPESNLSTILLDMEQEIGNFIMKMASSFQQRKEQLIFVINNYDIILSIMSEKTNGESHEAEYFRHQFSARISEYVEEILQPHFGELMQTYIQCDIEAFYPNTKLNKLSPRFEKCSISRVIGDLSGESTWYAYGLTLCILCSIVLNINQSEHI